MENGWSVDQDSSLRLVRRPRDCPGWFKWPRSRGIGACGRDWAIDRDDYDDIYLSIHYSCRRQIAHSGVYHPLHVVPSRFVSRAYRIWKRRSADWRSDVWPANLMMASFRSGLYIIVVVAYHTSYHCNWIQSIGYFVLYRQEALVSNEELSKWFANCRGYTHDS